MSPKNFIIIVAVILLIAAIAIAWYVQKSVRFAKGKYGKQSVKAALQRYAAARNYKLLENVQIEVDGETQTIDFILAGYFGLIFVSALQGQGDFYGDFKEEYWSFMSDTQKVRFLNPVREMDKKLDLFRKLMAQKKIYNVKIDPAVVVVGSKADTPLYLSHVGKENIVMDMNGFKKFLQDEKFEKDNGLDLDAVLKVLQ